MIWLVFLYLTIPAGSLGLVGRVVLDSTIHVAGWGWLVLLYKFDNTILVTVWGWLVLLYLTIPYVWQSGAGLAVLDNTSWQFGASWSCCT